ncbi:MAG: DUF4118 domain-containing protein [Acidobacteria bacterium]|nr:DUF4118 domain-containing protein [Acidobacteriota bacterium]
MPYILALIDLAILTAGMFAVGNHINPITVALIFLLFVLFLATVFESKPALFASVIAMLCFNFFFLPPILFSANFRRVVFEDVSERFINEFGTEKSRRV